MSDNETDPNITLTFTDAGIMIVAFKPSRDKFVAHHKMKIAGSDSAKYGTIKMINDQGDLILRFPHITE